jgi:hypothetical protein
MTPSLANFISSLVAGAIVVLVIGIALILLVKVIELHEFLILIKF